MRFYGVNNSPIWRDKYNRLFPGEQTNGGAEYAKKIEKYYKPIFEEFYPDSACVVAVTVENPERVVQLPGVGKMFVFLHQENYKTQKTLEFINEFTRVNKNVIFCCWLPALVEYINNSGEAKRGGYKAIYIPMAVDAEEILQYKDASIKPKDGVIWFGAIRKAKVSSWEFLAGVCEGMGLEFHTISNNHLDGGDRELSREEVMREIQKYKYGVGVGICAQEMATLGLKVILYAYDFEARVAFDYEKAKHLVAENFCATNERGVPIEDALLNRKKIIQLAPRVFSETCEILREELRKEANDGNNA